MTTPLEPVNTGRPEPGPGIEPWRRRRLSAAQIARSRGFDEKGYRVVINTNEDGGQTVFHLHVHLMAGRQFIFPPG